MFFSVFPILFFYDYKHHWERIKKGYKLETGVSLFSVVNCLVQKKEDRNSHMNAFGDAANTDN